VSCWNANEAASPSLTDESTVTLTDELNHASIIDAIRLSKPAQKVIYPHSDMSALRDALVAAPRSARKLVVTDGVFSMEGDLAKLPEIVELAREFDAVVIVDDSHGVGVLGETGRDRRALRLLGEWTSSRERSGRSGEAAEAVRPRRVCDLLAQRSRPQLFSNALTHRRVRAPGDRAHAGERAAHWSCATGRRPSAELADAGLPAPWTARQPSSRSSSARPPRRRALERFDEGVFVTGSASRVPEVRPVSAFRCPLRSSGAPRPGDRGLPPRTPNRDEEQAGADEHPATVNSSVWPHHRRDLSRTSELRRDHHGLLRRSPGSSPSDDVRRKLAT
jgi:hypothetical protein